MTASVALTTPPENGIVKAFRRVMPLIAALDYAILGIIIFRFGEILFVKGAAAWVEGSFIWFYEMLPACGVLLTGMVATGLITAQLSTLEADRADLASIGDATAKKERSTHLEAQIKVCQNQRVQSMGFILLYAVLASIPQVMQLDISTGTGRAFFLVLIVGEMLVPLLNMRTFTIVEQSLQKIDVIRNFIYASNNAAQRLLDGIADRAQRGELTKQDRRMLKAGRKGAVDKALEQREAAPKTERMQEEKYVSLRSAVTGVADGQPLREDQQKRYDRALAIARRYRDTQDPDILKHFSRGQHNMLFVSERMSGKIIADLNQVRIRPSRYNRIVQDLRQGTLPEPSDAATTTPAA